jgi:anti-sigma-K factor RskA
MNTPVEHPTDDLRYAEYVLGVLESDERAAVEREIAASSAAAAAEAQWRERLLPLAEQVPAQAPPERVWGRIRAALQFDAARSGGTRLWDNLRLWHWLTLGSGALLAAACAALFFILVHRPAAPPIPYMAATITEHGGQVGWTATMDISKARMVVVPAAPQPVQPGRTPELWLIPAGGRPIAVGLISTRAPITLALSAGLVARLGPTARLAVSIEPQGGSPTGQPTGPVVAAGPIGAAPAGGVPATAELIRTAPQRPA